MERDHIPVGGEVNDMRQTSQLYKDILAGLNTMHTVVEIETVSNGATEYVEIGEDKIYSVKTSGSLFPENKPSIGNFVSRELDLIIEPPENVTIPRRARIRLFVYAKNDSEQSERIPKGVFFIDTRDFNINKTKMMIHGYDAALLFEEDFSSNNIVWPITGVNLAIRIANSVGVSVGAGVIEAAQSFPNTMVPLQIGKTKREIMCEIAAAYCGNWIIDDQGWLRLVNLNTNPQDRVYQYLADENGNAILLGGERILVG